MLEVSAAFGRSAEFATHRANKKNNKCSGAGAPAPRHQGDRPLSSLPRHLFLLGELCKPPYSHQWLLSHRAQCRGSPLPPWVLPSPLPPSPLSAVPRGPEPEGTAGAGEPPPPKLDRSLWGDIEPTLCLDEAEHTPDSVQSLL